MLYIPLKCSRRNIGISAIKACKNKCMFEKISSDKFDLHPCFGDDLQVSFGGIMIFHFLIGLNFFRLSLTLSLAQTPSEVDHLITVHMVIN